MLHSFPGFKSNFLEIPRSKRTVYLTSGIHQESLLTVSFCVLSTYPHWNQHGVFCLFDWFLVFGLLGFSSPYLLLLSFLLSLLGKYFTETKSFNSPSYSKQQPNFSKRSKSNMFRSSFLSSCKLQNLPNVVYRIIAKEIRPICAIGSRIP